MTRLRLLAFAAGLIAAGIGLRLLQFGLPVSARHDGGGLLRGSMIFVLVAALRPPRWTWKVCLIVASFIAIAAGMLRLHHTPALDDFRLTLAGQLLFV